MFASLCISFINEQLMNSIAPISTEIEEVIGLCREIDILKSSGLEILSARLCKDAFLALSEQLVHNVCSLSSAKFPKDWKVAKIVPLFKGVDRENINNYRPVSLLPLPGKILEKIAHNTITQFLEGRDLLSASQGGFRKGFSTISTIADLIDDLFTAVNFGDLSIATFIDLKKAFNTVDTQILLKKLCLAGLRGDVLLWCERYMTDRVQSTIANYVKSCGLSVVCVVPQGSVLFCW